MIMNTAKTFMILTCPFLEIIGELILIITLPSPQHFDKRVRRDLHRALPELEHTLLPLLLLF